MSYGNIIAHLSFMLPFLVLGPQISDVCLVRGGRMILAVAAVLPLKAIVSVLHVFYLDGGVVILDVIQVVVVDVHLPLPPQH